MARPIYITFSEPVPDGGSEEPESYSFKVFHQPFPHIAVTVTREAIEDLARARGLASDPIGREAHLEELRRFQGEFVELADQKAGMADRVMITAADVAEMLR